jgi:hypothetical protein
MTSKQCVIDGKNYELTPEKSQQLQELFNSYLERARSIELPPLPKNCLSFKREEPVRAVWREYQGKAREIITGDSE